MDSISSVRPAERFRDAVLRRHEYAQGWKQRTGGKVVGCLCSYVPEEILAAAGILPVRVLGGNEPQDRTEAHMSGMFCSYSRDVLGQALLGRYSYLDGLVLCHCCAHIQQTFASWQKHIPLQFVSMLWVPTHGENSRALQYFISGVRRFKEHLEQWLGATISLERLGSIVQAYNLNRRLFLKLQELRRPHPPLVSGTEAMLIMLAGLVMDKEEHNRLLQEFLVQPAHTPQDGARLMVVGSELSDVEPIHFIESLGAVVVVEDACIANRHFSGEVSLDGDPMAGIALRYLAKPPCPQRDVGTRRRVRYLLEMAREYQVQGVVFLRQKFCDPHTWDNPIIQKAFQEQQIPSLALEVDVSIPYGQYRTRIEAFLESLVF